MFLPGPSAVVTGTRPDPTPISTQALYTGTERPHSETPEWFDNCLGTKTVTLGRQGPILL